MNKKVILALDNLALEDAINITNQIKDKLLTVKIGLQMWNLFGREGVKKFNEIGVNNLFLDLKMVDIPATTYSSTIALKGLKFGYLTVMALGGNEMVKEAKKAANEIDPNIKVLAVTILTSISRKELYNIGITSSVEDTVIQLAQNSNEADGYITSALESKLLRNKFPSKLIFVPGLRMPDDSKDDQVRTATPALALKNGADAIIMGRSLLSSGDINNNLEKVLNSIK